MYIRTYMQGAIYNSYCNDLLGEGAVLEDETNSRDTYTVNDVPVNVERHTPRHFDGIQRPSVNTSVVDQPTPQSAGKKRRLGNTEGDRWSQQDYGAYVC